MPRPPKDTKSFSALMQIVADLRGPDGCPWDRVQTYQTLAPFTIEEAYELAEVLDQPSSMAPGDVKLRDHKLKEELGDLLFQVALNTQIAQEQKSFTIDDVIQTLNEKMIRRHPHVFADSRVADVGEVWSQWEKIKSQEKKELETMQTTLNSKTVDPTPENSTPVSSTQQTIFDFPKHLPALQRAYKIGVKSQKRHFDWQQVSQVREKLTEELSELNQAILNEDKAAIQEELGDVLFTLAQVSRHLNVEPEQALRQSNHKFESRFVKMMTLAQKRGLIWEQLTAEERESLWLDVKKNDKNLEISEPSF